MYRTSRQRPVQDNPRCGRADGHARLCAREAGRVEILMRTLSLQTELITLMRRRQRAAARCMAVAHRSVPSPPVGELSKVLN